MSVLANQYAYDYDTFTSGTLAASTALTAAKVEPADRKSRGCAQSVLITISSGVDGTDGIRYRFDGPAPTASNGHYLQPDGTITIIGLANIKNFKMIRNGIGTAEAYVTYLRT